MRGSRVKLFGQAMVNISLEVDGLAGGSAMGYAVYYLWFHEERQTCGWHVLWDVMLKGNEHE
jgi:hypothetical protein